MNSEVLSRTDQIGSERTPRDHRGSNTGNRVHGFATTSHMGAAGLGVKLRFFTIVHMLAATGALPSQALAQCADAWRAGVGNPDTNNAIQAFAAIGNIMYAGGFFTSPANHVAAWNGTQWNSLGSGLNGNIYALTAFNNQPVAGGTFVSPGNRIARWNGTNWTAMASGFNAPVNALVVHNGVLIAGGYFSTSGGSSVNHVAQWNGGSWQSMGSGLDGSVGALLVYDGNLIAGGEFPGFIRQWTGATWQTVGTGISGGGPSTPLGVFALGIYNGDLIAGGQFNQAGSAPANSIAKWNGTTWNTLGSGVGGSFPLVAALGVHSSKLIAAGFFQSAGGNSSIHYIAQWNGSSWQGLGTGLDSDVLGLGHFNGDMVVGGYFGNSGGIPVSGWARWGPPRPSITAQPVDSITCVGGTGSFSTTVSGVGAIGYQWRRGTTILVNGGRFSGATGPTLTIMPTILADADSNYNCVVTDGCGAFSYTNDASLYVNPLPNAQAGGPYSGCGTNMVHLTGSASNQAGINWSSSGTGTFSNIHSLTPNYFPSTGDVNAGTVTLTLTALGIPPCASASSNAALSLTVPPTASAGGPYATCGMSAVVLAGAASHHSGVVWSSTGSGSFTSGDSLNATYHPSAPDIAAGSVSLTLTVSGNAPCGTIAVMTSLSLYPAGSCDANGDGVLSGQDITAFVNLLLNGGSVNAGYCAGDRNGDGVVTMADLEAFVSGLLAA